VVETGAKTLVFRAVSGMRRAGIHPSGVDRVAYVRQNPASATVVLACIMGPPYSKIRTPASKGGGGSPRESVPTGGVALVWARSSHPFRFDPQ
jgi:hypothetical protein